METPPRAAAPVAATVGIIKPAPSRPKTTEVATKAPRRLMTLAKFVPLSCMGPRIPRRIPVNNATPEGVGGCDGICPRSGRDAGASAVDGATAGVRPADGQGGE